MTTRERNKLAAKMRNKKKPDFGLINWQMRNRSMTGAYFVAKAHVKKASLKQRLNKMMGRA